LCHPLRHIVDNAVSSKCSRDQHRLCGFDDWMRTRSARCRSTSPHGYVCHQEHCNTHSSPFSSPKLRFVHLERGRSTGTRFHRRSQSCYCRFNFFAEYPVKYKAFFFNEPASNWSNRRRFLFLKDLIN